MAGSAGDAGGTLIAITALLAVCGWLAGGQVGLPIAGTMAGGLVGVIVGFLAVYIRFRDL